jgi:diguanylate cyclase (GGDEF)-like protein/PAS domain S-box-containing protein
MSGRVGFLLRNREECEIFRAAAQSCGLVSVDLTHRWEETALSKEGEPVISGTNTAPYQLPDLQSLLLIVTDDQHAAHHSWPAVGSQSLRAKELPPMLLVREAKLAFDSSADNGIDAERDAAYAGVLYRPLKLESTTAHLRQAMEWCRVFERRHRLILEELHRWRRVFESTSNGITICDVNKPDLPLVYVNPAFEGMTGYTAEEVCGHSCRFLQGKDADQPGLTVIREAIRERRAARALLKNYRKDGTLFWNELYLSPIRDIEGNLTHFVGVQNDVTVQVESARRLEYLAHHDALTGLANRGLLLEQLQQSILRASRAGGNVAVLFFDLDNFKHVNDVYGHDAGDCLLQVVAERLRKGTRGSETVARLGGDEFVVVLEDFSAERQPADVMQRLMSKVREGIDLSGEKFHPSASVGMALFPCDGDTPESLVKIADFNMYIAKHQRTSDECQGNEGSNIPESRPDETQKSKSGR